MCVCVYYLSKIIKTEDIFYRECMHTSPIYHFKAKVKKKTPLNSFIPSLCAKYCILYDIKTMHKEKLSFIAIVEDVSIVVLVNGNGCRRRLINHYVG